VAASDETFDPNDLDSIDALLDEAELEAADKNESPSEDDQEAIDTLLEEAEELAVEEEATPEVKNDPEVKEDLLDSLDDVVDDGAKAGLTQEKKADPVIKEATSSEEDFLSKRAAVQSNQNTKMTAEDMDSIKKLIIIFGATLIVLAFIGIGIGVWSALAAKSSAMDEETHTLIESTQVGTERVAVGVLDSSESIKAIDKKLDALNFQLEQLATDLAEAKPLESSAPKIDVIDPLGLGNKGLETHSKTPSDQKVTKPTESHVSATSTVSEANPAILSKVSSVNQKMIKAQRRIDEVNRRVKDIQSQYKALLHSVKSLEKQMVLQQTAAAEKEIKAKESKKSADNDPYQYSAPDSMFYDQSVTDSYP